MELVSIFFHWTVEIHIIYELFYGMGRWQGTDEGTPPSEEDRRQGNCESDQVIILNSKQGAYKLRDSRYYSLEARTSEQ